MCFRGNVFSGKCVFGEMVYGEMVRGEMKIRGIVRFPSHDIKCLFINIIFVHFLLLLQGCIIPCSINTCSSTNVLAECSHVFYCGLNNTIRNLYNNKYGLWWFIVANLYSSTNTNTTQLKSIFA
jgi:hypothetical protein